MQKPNLWMEAASKKSKRELLFDNSSDDDEHAEKLDFDQDALSKMTEVEREAYLFEKEQARAAKKERQELERRIRNLEKRENEAVTQSKQSSFEKKLRKMEQLRDSRKKKKPSDDSDYELSDEDESSLSVKNTPETSKSKVDVSLEDILCLQIKREVLEQHMFRPSFNAIAQGCFARINVGRSSSGHSVYRMCLISKVFPGTKSYLIGKTSTNLRGLLSIGSSQRECSLDIVSNSDITKDEFDFWKNSCEKLHSVFSQRSLGKKKQDFQKFINSPIEDEEFKRILELKKSSGNVSVNAAAEKAKLLIEMEEARIGGDTKLVEQIKLKLAEISNSSTENSTTTSVPVTTSRKLFTAGNQQYFSNSGDLDPFQRRKCKPQSSNIMFTDGQNDNNRESKFEKEQISDRKADAAKAASLKDLISAHKNFDLDLEI